MYNAVMEVFSDCDIVIKTAAVSDYRPSEAYQQKVKKIEDRLTVNLVRNPDILKELAKKKGKRILVGFAAESTNIEEYATGKLEEKNLDLIVANDITQEGAGFGSETNYGLIMDRKGNKEYLPIMSKEQMSDIILDKVVSLIKAT
jgi:phosphopantothenoylcysteine decarboxylase/phosphopantothenate--cysteine ligase